jgi:hypothetical protein
MAAEEVKSTKVQALEAKPAQPPEFDLGYGAPIRIFTDEYEVATTTSSTNSEYQFIELPSHAALISGNLRGDGTVDQPDLDVGLVHIADDGTVTEYDGVLATALDVDDTGDHFFYGNIFGMAGDNDGELKRLWELAGLSSDPGGKFRFFAKTDAANVALGTVEAIVYAITD